MKMNELNMRFFFQYFQKSDSKILKNDTQNDFLYLHELCRHCVDVVRSFMRRVSNEAVVNDCESDDWRINQTNACEACLSRERHETR